MPNVNSPMRSTVIRGLQDGTFEAFANLYGEPGYSNPDSGILLTDSIDALPEEHIDELHTAGYDVREADGWIIHNNRAYRTEHWAPGWEPSYTYTAHGDDLVTCHDSPASIIEAMQATDTSPYYTPLPSSWGLDPREHGFTLVDQVLPYQLHSAVNHYLNGTQAVNLIVMTNGEIYIKKED